MTTLLKLRHILASARSTIASNLARVPAGRERPLEFAGPRQPIRVSGAAPLARLLPFYLPDWPRRPGAAAGSAADVRIERTAGGFRVIEGNPPRAETVCAEAGDAAFALLSALIGCFVAQDPRLVCLHAAACLLGPGLVVMVGDAMAGKSTLAAHIAQLGLRLFGDDGIVVRLSREGADSGLSLAMPYKLRLPLPADAAEGFETFVEAHLVRRWEVAVQLRLVPEKAAAFGETAPLQALVVLERTPGTPAVLEPAPHGLVVRELIRYGFAPQMPLDDLVRELTALAGRLPAYRLRYGRSAEAAALVAERFAGPGNETRR